MRQTIRIEIDGQLPWEVARSDAGRWVGVCRPLGLTMEAQSLDELHQCINDAVQLLLSDLLESDELDSFLSSHGWRIGQASGVAGDVAFDVPMELLVRTGGDSARTLLQ